MKLPGGGLTRMPFRRPLPTPSRSGLGGGSALSKSVNALAIPALNLSGTRLSMSLSRCGESEVASLTGDTPDSGGVPLDDGGRRGGEVEVASLNVDIPISRDVPRDDGGRRVGVFEND